MRDSSVLLIAVTSLVINNHCCLLSCTNLQHCQPLNVLLSDQTVKIILFYQLSYNYGRTSVLVWNNYNRSYFRLNLLKIGKNLLQMRSYTCIHFYTLYFLDVFEGIFFSCVVSNENTLSSYMYTNIMFHLLQHEIRSAHVHTLRHTVIQYIKQYVP